MARSRITEKEYRKKVASLPTGTGGSSMSVALLVSLLQAVYSLRVARFFVSRIIAGDFDWNKANHCDCAINMFISLFTYIF